MIMLNGYADIGGGGSAITTWNAAPATHRHRMMIFARLRRVTTGVYDTLSQGTTYASSRYLDATQRSVGNDSSNTVAAYGIARRTAGDEKLALTPSVDAAATNMPTQHDVFGSCHASFSFATPVER